MKIERENQTLATITFQNYFRKYKKLSGMTGTADTEAEEFAKIYKLDVIVIPTEPRAEARRRTRHRLPHGTREVRRDRQRDHREAGRRPAGARRHGLDREVGAAARSSLKLRGIKHVVLNAKYHAQEAEIVAQAGRKGTVTIATNMAGRGTDILLGGNPEFMARQQTLAEQIAERLPKGQEKFVDDDDFVYFYHLDNFYRVPRPITSACSSTTRRRPMPSTTKSSTSAACTSSAPSATKRGASTTSSAAAPAARAIPGSSRFYLSLEDDLMRIFGSDRISGLMQRLGMEEGVPIEHGMVTKAIERAQKQVEAQNFSTRKHLLEYDDVMNKQRESVYALRRELLEGKIRITDEEDGRHPRLPA